MEYRNLELQRFWNGQATLTITGEQEEIEKIVSDLFKKESKTFESKSEFISPAQMLEKTNEKNPFEPETIEFETGEDDPEETINSINVSKEGIYINTNCENNAKFSVKNFKVGDVVYFQKDSLMFEKDEIFEITDITSSDIDVELLNGREFCYSHDRFIELEPTVVDIEHDGLFERLKFAKKLGEELTYDTDFSGVKGIYNTNDEFGSVGDKVEIVRDDKDEVPRCFNVTIQETFYYELGNLTNVFRESKEGE